MRWPAAAAYGMGGWDIHSVQCRSGQLGWPGRLLPPLGATNFPNAAIFRYLWRRSPGPTQTKAIVLRRSSGRRALICVPATGDHGQGRRECALRSGRFLRNPDDPWRPKNMIEADDVQVLKQHLAEGGIAQPVEIPRGRMDLKRWGGGEKQVE